MFWNKKNNEDLYVRCDDDNFRSAFRIEPGSRDSGVMLLVDGEQVSIENISANGVAFRLCDACDPAILDSSKLQGILFIGSQRNPIPVELDVVIRQGGLLRCRIGNQNLLAQKKLTEAISQYQKQQIRAGECATDLDDDE